MRWRLSALLLLVAAPAAVALQSGDYTYSTNSNGQATITDFNSAYTGELSITNVLDGCSVVGIGTNAFASCSSLTDITIPESVKNIGNQAFIFCSNLTRVTIGSSVTNIGGQAFESCTKLTNAVIPASVINIGLRAFRLCSGLPAIHVSGDNSAYSSADGVLFNKNRTKLIQYPGGKFGGYTIPESVTNIGYAAFQYCYGLTGLTCGNNVAVIEESAFYGCNGLANVMLGNSVVVIGNQAFSGCTGLTNITIPNSVTSIVYSAFSSCTNLRGVYFMGNAPNLGVDVFRNDTNLTVYRVSAATGWPPVPDLWGGRPTALWGPISLVVNGGTGSGSSYTNGQQVSITADAAPLGWSFDRWVGATQYVASVVSSNTTVKMPAQDISVSATYRITTIPVGDTNAVTVVSDNSGDGGTSVKLGGAGLLADGRMAGIGWSVAGPGVLAFDWRVSSEAGYDWLRFYEVGGSETNLISGTGEGWSRVTVTVGGMRDTVHTFRWEYVKDESEYVGLDCGWIDVVTWSKAYTLTVNHGTGGGLYTNNAHVFITADAPSTGLRFNRWAGDTGSVSDALAVSTTLVMPAADVVVTATYTPLVFYALTVNGGTGSGFYTNKACVTITAGTPQPGERFNRWAGDTNCVENVFSSSTTVVMPATGVIVTATYTPLTYYTLTVNGGTGGGLHAEGSAVTVRAAPDPMYMEFAGWTGDAAGFLGDASAPTSSLTMPACPASLTANYRASVARVAGCYGRSFTVSGAPDSLSTDVAAGSPSGTPAVKLGGAGVVPDNGFVALETTVSGSGTVTFWWRVSSESNGDFLKFKVDGQQAAAISGTKAPWAQVSHRVEGTGLTHNLRWEYVKNGALASSTDAGWVDDIVWTGDVPDPVIRPDIRTTAVTNNVIVFTFLGERGIPYTVFSNATLDALGWAPMATVPQAIGETNGVFRFEAVVIPPVGQRSGFYRLKGGYTQ